VRDALAEHLDADEVGASIAVDLDGDTVVNVWSTTKCVLNLAALMLVERGKLDV
jgi:CubicO group peptidase (beta-lactamase class C family)